MIICDFIQEVLFKECLGLKEQHKCSLPICPSVSTLKEQLEEMKKISQNSQASNDKIAQLQNQVCSTHTFIV